LLKKACWVLSQKKSVFKNKINGGFLIFAPFKRWASFSSINPVVINKKTHKTTALFQVEFFYYFSLPQKFLW
jgi:hypothetical protein